jgi:hypothetical protein
LLLKEAKNRESLNSRVVFKVNLDEIPSTLGVNSILPCSLATKVSPFHVIFYFNKLLIATHFDKSFHTIIPHFRLKEFLEVQFQVYIWFATQHHNIYNYLDQIWHKTKIFIHASRVFD